MTRTILAIIENECFPEQVVTRAARISKVYDCDLRLVLSDPTVSFLRGSFMISAESKLIADNVHQAQQEQLDRLVDSIAEFELNTSTTIIKDKPASDAIVAMALEVEPLAVVKGTRYHSAAERAITTYNDWRLIRKLDCPLWLVRDRDWQEKPVVIAAVDPIHPDDEEGVLTQVIVDSAMSVANKTEGSLLLLHTYELLEEIGKWAKLEFKPLKVPVAELQSQMEDEHRHHLNDLANRNGIDDSAVHMLPGRTHEVLPGFVRETNADLVVMGAVARSGIKRRVIGSTAEHVLDHVPCDVLIERAG